MSRQRSDITPTEVTQLMATGEDITRRFLGEVLDVVADTATERAARWAESEEAIRNLRRIRRAISDGEELTYAVIDFWISVLPDPDFRTLRVQVTDDEHDTLEQLAKTYGTDPQGFVTMLAQKAVVDAAPKAQPVDISRRRAFIVAVTREQGEAFIMANAVAFTGWSVAIHNRSRSGWEHLQDVGRYDLVVILGGEPLSVDETRQVATMSSLVVHAEATLAFDPNETIAALEGA